MFPIIFYSLYILLNIYIFRRGLKSIAVSKKIKVTYILLFIFLFVTPILGSALVGVSSVISRFFNLIGLFWQAAMLYFFLIILILDLIRLINHFIHFYPSFIIRNYNKTKFVLGVSVVGIVIISLIYGYWNNLNPQIKTIDLTIPKKVDSLKTMNLVFISDIHYSKTNGLERFKLLVNKINTLNPDIVVFGGDFFDGRSLDFLNVGLGNEIRSIKSKFGIFSVIGNHDYILNFEKVQKFFSDNGIVLLKDSVVKINNSIYLIGRRYVQSDESSEFRRKSFAQLLENVDKGKPIILIDHKPNILMQAVENGIDLQLSGHSHHAQLWPLNYITEMIYDLDWGYKKINNTQFYVTCGFGTWGPPIRLGSYPEIVNIILHFE